MARSVTSSHRSANDSPSRSTTSSTRPTARPAPVSRTCSARSAPPISAIR
jgi:hypothetical protein